MSDDISTVGQRARSDSKNVSVLRQRLGRALHCDIGAKASTSTISSALAAHTYILYGTRLALYAWYSIYLYRQLVLIILLSDFQGGCLV
jgi:hypothetical protein